MSVLSAVTRAMRSGRVITPNEFPVIQREALATIDLSQMQAGDYLLRGEAAEALRGARFRNESEQRAFYLSFLHQSRDRIQAQLQAMLASVPEETGESSFGCYSISPGRGEAVTFTPAECFFSGGIGFGLRSGRDMTPSTGGFSNGLLRYLAETLPAHAFIGIPSEREEGFFEIQLLDGVQFTAENFQAEELPPDTRIHTTTLRLLYRASVCAESRDLPDCR